MIPSDEQVSLANGVELPVHAGQSGSCNCCAWLEKRDRRRRGASRYNRMLCIVCLLVKLLLLHLLHCLLIPTLSAKDCRFGTSLLLPHE